VGARACALYPNELIKLFHALDVKPEWLLWARICARKRLAKQLGRPPAPLTKQKHNRSAWKAIAARRASMPLDAIRGVRDTPIWKVENRPSDAGPAGRAEGASSHVRYESRKRECLFEFILQWVWRRFCSYFALGLQPKIHFRAVRSTAFLPKLVGALSNFVFQSAHGLHRFLG
jgi:hypothetical protein